MDNRRWRALGPVAGVVLTVSLAIALAACSPYRGGNSNSAPQSVSCDDVVDSVIQRERVGETGSAIDRELQWLTDNCDDGFDVAIDYISTASMAKGQFGPETCDFLLEHNINPESVRLLRADGLCTGPDSGAPWLDSSTQSAWPNGGLGWDQAVNYVGTSQRVCGPLMSMRTSNDDVFLNIGADYPDSGRFVVVVWDIGGVKQESPGLTICVSGVITSYNGVAQIELRDLGPIEIWD